MPKFIIPIILAVILSFVIEKISDNLLKDKKFNISGKINIKRFTALLAVNLAFWLGFTYLGGYGFLLTLLVCFAFDILLSISLSDYYTKQFSTLFLIVLLILALAFTVFDTAQVWYMHILGAAIGFFPLFLLRIITGKKENAETLGAGDLYLSGILGLFLGLQNFLFCGIFAGVAGLIVIKILKRKNGFDKTHYYPFSPFFALGFALAALFGNLITNGYYSLVTSFLM